MSIFFGLTLADLGAATAVCCCSPAAGVNLHVDTTVHVFLVFTVILLNILRYSSKNRNESSLSITKYKMAALETRLLSKKMLKFTARPLFYSEFLSIP